MEKALNAGKMEDKILKYINMIRHRPTDFIRSLKLREIDYKENSYIDEKTNKRYHTKEDYTAVHEAIDFLMNCHPVIPLERNKKLDETAKAHSDFLIKENMVSNVGVGGLNPEERISKVRGKGSLGEAISLFENRAKQIVINLLIDDGLVERPNRKMLICKDFNEIGISLNKHPSKNFICVLHFWGSPIARIKYNFPFNELDEEPW